MAQPTALKKPCCTTAATKHSHYKPKGTDINVNDLIVYESPYKDPTRVVICAYDIFGFHNNTKEVADLLGEQGNFRVIMPDFYRGDYWRDDRPTQLMYSWFNYTCGWADTKRDIMNLMWHYRNEGATSFAVFGFCWGGKVSVLSAIEIDGINCVGLVHPSGVKIEEANRVKCPVIVMPSSEEHDFIPFMNKVIDRLGDDSCVHCRFQNMEHGFCAARGDFQDPATQKAVRQVIDHLNHFFNAHMPPPLTEDSTHKVGDASVATLKLTTILRSGAGANNDGANNDGDVI